MYNYYKFRNKKLILNFSLLFSIVISICMLSIGYAAIVATDIKLNVTASAGVPEGIFISDVTYLTNNSADLGNSKIINYFGTTLHSDIYLSTTNQTSSITYKVTIFNNSDSLKQFTGITYLDEYYSNPNIQYRLDGLNLKDTIDKGQGKTFNITFYYNSQTIVNNNLNSYLNFNFDYYFEEEVDVDINISSEGSYEFAGVSPEHPIDLANIANITFDLKNGLEKIITGFRVDIAYITTTGSKQSALIDLEKEDGTLLSTKTVQFEGKQSNGATLSIYFENITVNTGDIVKISFDKSKITNGRVNTTRVSITPIFSE